jgi:hypothetical protein
MAFFKPIIDLLNKDIGPTTQVSVVTSSPGASSQVKTENLLKITLEPIEISGFYTVTGSNEATFYAMTDKPIIPVGPGWFSTFVIGIQGNIQVKSVSLSSGPGYLWSFVFQVGTSQNIEGTQQVASSTLYPPRQMAFTPAKITTYSSPQNVFSNVQVQLNSNVNVGNYAPLRDLNTDVSWIDYQPDGRIFPRSPMIEPGTGIKGWSPPLQFR